MGGGGGPAGGGGCRPVPPVPDISPSSSAPEVSGSFELLTWLAAGELKLWLSATPAAFPAASVAKFADLGTGAPSLGFGAAIDTGDSVGGAGARDAKGAEALETSPPLLMV